MTRRVRFPSVALAVLPYGTRDSGEVEAFVAVRRGNKGIVGAIGNLRQQ